MAPLVIPGTQQEIPEARRDAGLRLTGSGRQWPRPWTLSTLARFTARLKA